MWSIILAMKITINGQDKDIADKTSLSSLVQTFSPNNNRVITELNGTIIANTNWNATVLNEGDVVELIAFVGGG